MSELIKDIFYTLNFEAQISSQPLIHGIMKGGRLVVHFKDGRVIDKIEMEWDESPYILMDKRLNGYEVGEINMMLRANEDTLYDSLSPIIKNIKETTIKGMITEEVKEEFYED